MTRLPDLPIVKVVLVDAAAGALPKYPQPAQCVDVAFLIESKLGFSL